MYLLLLHRISNLSKTVFGNPFQFVKGEPTTVKHIKCKNFPTLLQHDIERIQTREPSFRVKHLECNRRRDQEIQEKKIKITNLKQNNISHRSMIVDV